MNDATQSTASKSGIPSLPNRGRGPLTSTPRDRPATAVPPEGKDSEEETEKRIYERHAHFSEESHAYLREYIRNADQKATFLFAALTALLAFLNSQNVPARWLTDIRSWTFIDGLGFLSMLGLALGAGILLWVIFPRLKGTRRGLLFFQAIAEYENSTEYAGDVLSQSDEDIVRAKLLHCHELSRICKAKYLMLRVGFYIGAIGVVVALLYLLLAKNYASVRR